MKYLKNTAQSRQMPDAALPKRTGFSPSTDADILENPAVLRKIMAEAPGVEPGRTLAA